MNIPTLALSYQSGKGLESNDSQSAVYSALTIWLAIRKPTANEMNAKKSRILLSKLGYFNLYLIYIN